MLPDTVTGGVALGWIGEVLPGLIGAFAALLRHFVALPNHRAYMFSGNRVLLRRFTALLHHQTYLLSRKAGLLCAICSAAK